MIDISTDEGKSELAAELRRRYRVGRVGTRSYQRRHGIPCCPVGHFMELTGLDMAQSDDYLRVDGQASIEGITDHFGAAMGIEEIVKRLGVTE